MEGLALPEHTLVRAFRFKACHFYRLPQLSLQHNRDRFGASADSHQHDWVLTIWVTGPLDPVTSMMVDLGKLDGLVGAELLPFEGATINDLDPIFDRHLPTCERLALYFHQRLKSVLSPLELSRLRIAESPDLYSEYVP